MQPRIVALHVIIGSLLCLSVYASPIPSQAPILENEIESNSSCASLLIDIFNLENNMHFNETHEDDLLELFNKYEPVVVGNFTLPVGFDRLAIKYAGGPRKVLSFAYKHFKDDDFRLLYKELLKMMPVEWKKNAPETLSSPSLFRKYIKMCYDENTDEQLNEVLLGKTLSRHPRKQTN